MKILIADTTVAGDLIGGAQTFLPKLTKNLVVAGAEVSLIADGVPHPKIRRSLEDAGVRVFTDSYDPKVLVEDSTPRLASWINKLAPDIYVVSVSPDVGWTVLPFINSKTATLTIGHTDSETFYAPLRHYREFITSAVGVSREVCTNFVRECGLDETRVRWIPYGVEAADELVLNDSETIKLCYVGRLEEEQKRVSDIIKIIERLREKNLDFRFDVVGDGAAMTQFKVALKAEIAAGAVKMHGWLDEKPLLEILRQSEIFILTSAYEGFCISLVEAMANGCCPLVTNIDSGNKQLVEPARNGFLLPIGATENFAEKICDLAENREKLWDLRQNAWMSGKIYSIGKMVEAYTKSFAEAVSEARGNPRTATANFPLMPSCRSKYPLWARRIKAFATKR